MKLTTFILITVILQVSATTFAQKITLSEKNSSLVKVFDKISDQSGYDFLVSSEMLRNAKPVNIEVSNLELKEVLKKIFEEQPLDYNVQEKMVVVSKKTPSFIDNIIARFTDIDVRGRVVDEGGKPLEGATVILKGTERTTKTDVKGEFVLANVPDDGVLVIRYVGYKQLEIGLKDAVMPLEIKLNVATGELEEVKVVYNTGYQELNKERATGSFVHINNELFNRSVGASVLDRIKDVVPGVYSTNGTRTIHDFTIRGVTTINADKIPLLVVDNFIYEGDLNQINPNDIESVTILKDAAASSIWGVRAGNGVIVLTTKRGRLNQEAKISFNSNITMGEKPDLLSAPSLPSKDVIALERTRFNSGFYNALLSNTTTYPVLSPVIEILAKVRAGTLSEGEGNKIIANYENHDVRGDIENHLLQTTIDQQYAFNISGGSTTHTYYGSVGYDKSRLNEINKSNDRLTLRFTNSWSPVKNLKLNTELNWGQNRNNDKSSLAGYQSILAKSPYLKLADENGNPLSIPWIYRSTYIDNINFPGKLDWNYRPIDEAGNGNQKSLSNNMLIGGGLDYFIISGLKASLGYQWQKTLTEVKNIRSLETFSTRDLINRFVTIDPANGLLLYPYPLGAVYQQYNNSQKGWSFRGQLNFDKAYGKHSIFAIAGLETREIDGETTTMPLQYGYDPQTNTFQNLRIGSWRARPRNSLTAINPRTSELRGNVNRFGSSFGNAAYTYDNKYTISASGRIDQSNFFGVKANDRKVPLWSAGVAWDIAKEKFYNIQWLADLKLRASYGYSGNVNAGTSPLATGQILNPADPLFVPYASLVTSPNPRLSWEKVKQINFGVDFGLINRRVIGSLELYQKRGIDLISQITVDPTSGFTSYSGNQSSILGRGIDFQLNTRNLVGNFTWSSSFIYSYNKSKVTSYSVEQPHDATIFVNVGGSGAIEVGKPLNAIYSFNWAGLDPSNGDARFYLNGVATSSSQINDVKREDLIYHGTSSPKTFGTFRNDFSYKNIHLSLNITYQLGYFFTRTSFGGGIPLDNTFVHADYLKAWKVPGDELKTNVPGFLNSYPDQRYRVYEGSNILVEKGDNIRLQDVRINYNIKRNFLKKLSLEGASIYLYINNLGFVWKRSEYSPDTKNSITTIPPRRSIAFGMTLNL